MQYNLQKHFRDGHMPIVSISRFINEDHSQNYTFSLICIKTTLNCFMSIREPDITWLTE